MVVGQRRSVHQPPVDAPSVPLDPIHDVALVVGLEEDEVHGSRARTLPENHLDVGKRLRAVMLGLAPTEKVEIRAVQDADAHDVSRGRARADPATPPTRSRIPEPPLRPCRRGSGLAAFESTAATSRAGVGVQHRRSRAGSTAPLGALGSTGLHSR